MEVRIDEGCLRPAELHDQEGLEALVRRELLGHRATGSEEIAESMAPHLTKKKAVALAAAFFLVGCHPRPRAHTVVMAWEAFPLSLDPRTGNDQASERLLGLTHQGLLRRDATLRLVPDGCLAWRWERPYTELAFDFPRPGEEPAGWFRFAPGRFLRAEDALWSVKAMMDPAVRGAKASVFQAEIGGAWVAGSTLHLRLNGQDPGFPSNLIRSGLGLVPQGTAGDATPGTGPYRILSLVPEQRMLLEARRDHPDFSGKAAPQDLEIRLMPDAAARLLALRHGSVQLAVSNL